MKKLITFVSVLTIAVAASSPVYAFHHHPSHHHSSHHHSGAAAAIGFLGGFAMGNMMNRPLPPPRTVVYTAPAPIYQTPVAQAFTSQSSFVRRQLQAKLQQMGFYYSYVDGVWGPATQSAIESYASNSGNVHLLTTYAGANEIIRILLSS